jgi:hypothetical protein
MPGNWVLTAQLLNEIEMKSTNRPLFLLEMQPDYFGPFEYWTGTFSDPNCT